MQKFPVMFMVAACAGVPIAAQAQEARGDVDDRP